VATPYSTETLSRIAQLRAKILDNTITLEEMKEGVILLRQDRKSAASSSDSTRRAKAKAAIPSADDMLDELGGI
jgi:hypothetical protein